MNRTIDNSDTTVELARRRGDGLEIALLWHRQDNRLEVVVADDRSGASFALATGNGREALEVFYHPFAYAAAGNERRGAMLRPEPRRPLRDRPGSSARVEAARELLSTAVETAHHRPLRDAQRAGRLGVGEAGHVDGDDDVAKLVRESRHGSVHLRRLERLLGPGRGPFVDELDAFRQRLRLRSPLPRAPHVQERVAEDAEQVAEVVLVAKEPRPRKHARVRLLDEVLGILARAAERPRGPVEPVEVIAEPSRIELTLQSNVPPGSLTRPETRA